MRTFALVTVLAACGNGAPRSSTVAMALSSPAGCIDPATYGATPNDGSDDRVAIQAALDAAAAAGGREVCLGPGAFDVTTAPAGSYNHFAALSWHSPNIILRGAGELATVLRVSGDQGGAGPVGIISLDPGSSGAAIRELAFDTSAATHTGEQFHALEIGSGVGDTPTGPTVSNVTIEHVRFNHPVNPAPVPGERKGDCIRLLGNVEASEVRNVKLLDLDFLACARSGVSMQRNVNALTISHGYFDGDHIGGAPIDGEATGGGWSHGLVVEASIFVRVAPGGEPYAIELTSQTNYAITGNVFIGRGIFAYRTTDGTFTGNTLDCTDCTSAGVLEFQNQADRIAIGVNAIRRRGTHGDAIHVNPHSGGFANGISIAGVIAINETDGACIYLHSANDVSIVGGTCIGSGLANSIGVYAAALSRPMDGLVVTGVEFRGFAFSAVEVAPSSSYGISGALVTGNIARASGPMKCPLASTFAPGALVHTPNAWSSGDACTAP